MKRRASESRFRPRKKCFSEGKANPSTIMSMAITSTNSMRVKPLPPLPGSAFLLPVRDVIIASHAPVGSHGNDVVGGRVVFARALVNVLVAPRVFGDAFQVGPV